MVRKKVGKVVMPIKVHALHPKLFRGLAFMEMAQDKANELDGVVKTLAPPRSSGVPSELISALPWAESTASPRRNCAT